MEVRTDRGILQSCKCSCPREKFLLHSLTPATCSRPQTLQGLLSVAAQCAVNTQDSETLSGIARLQMMAMCSGDNLAH